MNILIACARNIARNEIYALVKALQKKHRITISSMSKDSPLRGLAFSFSMSPTRVNKMLYKRASGEPIQAYEFYSTPADSISIMLGEIMKHQKPDLVICGISNGTNMGPDTYSSSVIGMAMEATFFGVPAIALATTYKEGGHSAEELAPLATFIENNIEKFAALKLPPQTFLSVNVPMVEKHSDFKGVHFTRMGRKNMRLEYAGGVDPLGRDYYWSKIARREHENDGEQDDGVWYKRGFISIAPLCYDATCHESIEDFTEIAERLKGGKK